MALRQQLAADCMTRLSPNAQHTAPKLLGYFFLIKNVFLEADNFKLK